jgi:hypothetical protein
MIDVSTHAGVMRFCEARRDEMTRCFERVGRFEENGYSFGAYVFATRGFKDKDFNTYKLDAVEPMVCRFPKMMRDKLPPSEHTKAFGHVLREFAKITEAVGTVVMGEAWLAKTPEGVKSREEADRWRREQPESLEDMPGRLEGMFMSLEHQAIGKRFWRRFIEREPTRLGPWGLLPLQGTEGRLVDITRSHAS